MSKPELDKPEVEKLNFVSQECDPAKVNDIKNWLRGSFKVQTCPGETHGLWSLVASKIKKRDPSLPSCAHTHGGEQGGNGGLFLSGKLFGTGTRCVLSHDG